MKQFTTKIRKTNTTKARTATRAKNSSTVKRTRKSSQRSGLDRLFSRNGLLTPRTSLLLFVLLFASVGAYLLFRTEAATPAASSRMGVYRGSNGSAEVAKYESWIGHPVNYALDFLGRSPEDSADPWNNIDNPGWWCNSWSSTKYTVVYTAAMLPNHSTTLAAGAKGNYNAHWKSFGQTMVNRGCGDAILRLGHEFNGKFYPWSAADGKDLDYAAYWRQIVNTLRAVPGQSFKYDWSPLAGVENGTNPENAWPGGDYVDIIGLDAYDTGRKGTSGAERWQTQLDRVYGLKWHKQFAESKKKPISYPEWGLSNPDKADFGGGDNPYYIQKMYEWMDALPATGPGSLAYQMYFEYDHKTGNARLMTGEYPNAAAKFKALFGGSSSSTPPPSTPPPATTDTTPPTTPTNPIATPTSSTQINISWTAATDNVGVTGYDIYRGGTKINTTVATSYSDKSLKANTSYSYYVKAIDDAGNVSGPSTTVSAIAKPASSTPDPEPTVTTKTYTATLSQYGSKKQTLKIPKAGTIKYTLATKEGNGRYDVTVYDANNKVIAQLQNTNVPLSGTFIASKAGNYTIAIKTRFWSARTHTLKVTYPN